MPATASGRIFKGRVAGAAVNMFIDPLTVEAAGHQAMLDFGQALVSGAPIFTFPLAPNLQAQPRSIRLRKFFLVGRDSVEP
jgi:hypothetical protein